MNCDRFSEIHAYHDGQLGPAVRAAFENHLGECGDCTQLLRELRAVSQLIASAPLPDVTAISVSRYYDAWTLSRQRGPVERGVEQ